MKDIKDYLHLYLGCLVHDELWDGKHQLQTGNFHWIIDCIKGGRHKLILRPLSDMTKEEHGESAKSYIDAGADINIIQSQAARIKYLLSKGFDLFGLIESNLAIDKTKISEIANR